jgi:hypothetical protein
MEDQDAIMVLSCKELGAYVSDGCVSKGREAQCQPRLPLCTLFMCCANKQKNRLTITQSLF